MADYTPVFPSCAPFTSTASGTIVAGDVVIVSGSGTVAASGAGGKGIGVAANGVAADQKVTVYPLRGQAVHQTVAGAGGVTAGDYLKVGATAGKLITWVGPGDTDTTLIVGIALTTAAADAALRWLAA